MTFAQARGDRSRKADDEFYQSRHTSIMPDSALDHSSQPLAIPRCELLRSTPGRSASTSGFRALDDCVRHHGDDERETDEDSRMGRDALTQSWRKPGRKPPTAEIKGLRRHCGPLQSDAGSSGINMKRLETPTTSLSQSDIEAEHAGRAAPLILPDPRSTSNRTRRRSMIASPRGAFLPRSSSMRRLSRPISTVRAKIATRRC